MAYFGLSLTVLVFLMASITLRGALAFHRRAPSSRFMRMSSSAQPGHAYFIATPIGNLGDITLRAIDLLDSVDIVCAEDTRHTRKLLQHLDIKPKRLVAHHEHNAIDSAAGLVQLLKEGNSIGLVSDAGTPGISDPGTELAALCGKEGIPCVPVPGPSAVVSALSVCGFPSSVFTFLGFLPVKGKARQDLLLAVDSTAHCVVLYEAPHRVLDTMKALQALRGGEGGDRPVCVCRELTKLHEEIRRGTVTEMVQWLKEREKGTATATTAATTATATAAATAATTATTGDSGCASASSSSDKKGIRGEFCLVLGPRPVGANAEQDVEAGAVRTLLQLREDGLSRSEAVKLCAGGCALPKSAVYKLALGLDGWAAVAADR
jgi:16S rRNA (cytidine1402-2'-O)-methyltransferase